MTRVLAVLPAALLAACAGEPFDFASEKERQCYYVAEAAIDSPNTRLERGRTGLFVEVTQVNGFVRDADPSQAFLDCMSTPDDAVGPVVAEAAPVTFTPEEQGIWNGLTDAQKRDALIFIQQGGTLRGYLEQ